MSNTPANNPPECDPAPTARQPDSDDPEPGDPESDRPMPVTALSNHSQIEVDIHWDESVEDRQGQIGLSDSQIADATRIAARERGFNQGQIGIRITDDTAIHEINVRHLSHDYPTDVISFPYSDDPSRIEGELVASIDTASENAADAGWSTKHELLLYIIHGVLHIGGMEDLDDQDRADMRRAEQSVLASLGINGEPAREGALDE